MRNVLQRAAAVLSSEFALSDALAQVAGLLAAAIGAESVTIALAESEATNGVPLEITAGEAGADGSDESKIDAPIAFGDRRFGALIARSPRPGAFDEGAAVTIESCAFYVGTRIHDEVRRKADEEVRRAAGTDALTGIANRRSFDESLAQEWRRCARSGESLALAMIDVDYFKRYNDAYGHLAGDACLKRIAQAVAGCLKRPGDLAARYGGEEFVLVLPGSDAAGAIEVAESVCQAVRALAIDHEGSSLGHATLSVGVAVTIPDAQSEPQSLIAAADARLYDAKKGGRNRVASAGYTGEGPAAEPRVAKRHNLPRYLSELVGRERDVAALTGILAESSLALVTGAGGAGKTRLAVEVAQRLLDAYPDGAWFVDLGSLDDPALVPNAIAQALEVPDEGGSRTLLDRLCLALKDRKLLLLLDNCEHVLDAVADAAVRLLGECPQLRLLATSREPLGVPGECDYRLDALDVPRAIELFVARAHALQHAFSLTAENYAIVEDIVRRLDGIPLAIELAAARVRVLGVAQLDRRLDERFKLLASDNRKTHARQRTLLALIGWSYDLLDDVQRRLLRSCGIFRGGWTLDAIEFVSGDGLGDRELLDVLASLVDKSLVAVDPDADPPRYRMLESTRQFVLDRLDESGERDAVAGRHCRYFAERAEAANVAYWGHDSDAWMAEVRLDIENYRAAIAWGLDHAPGDAAIVIGSLRWYWFYASRSEGWSLVERAEAVLPAEAAASIRGRMAAAAALLAFGSAKAGNQAERALQLLTGEADGCDRAEVLARDAYLLGLTGRIAESLEKHERALDVARTTQKPRLIARVLTTCGYWYGVTGDRARAHRYYDEASALLRASGDRRRFAQVEFSRGDVLFVEGDTLGALECARRAEHIYREYRSEANLANALRNEAAYLLALGRVEEAEAAARESLELVLNVGDAYWVAIAIGHLAHVAAERGDVERAARLLGFTDELFRKNGTAREPAEQRGYDRAIALVRAALPADRLAALLAEGAALEETAAVAEAIHERSQAAGF